MGECDVCIQKFRNCPEYLSWHACINDMIGLLGIWKPTTWQCATNVANTTEHQGFEPLKVNHDKSYINDTNKCFQLYGSVRILWNSVRMIPQNDGTALQLFQFLLRKHCTLPVWDLALRMLSTAMLNALCLLLFLAGASNRLLY